MSKFTGFHMMDISPPPPHHQLQGLGLLTCSNLRVSQTDPSISLVVQLSLFFLQGDNPTASEGSDNPTASEGSDKLALLKQVLSSSIGVLLLSLLD
jgi:hypothetical protein